jgi:hypothetical protein
MLVGTMRKTLSRSPVSRMSIMPLVVAALFLTAILFSSCASAPSPSENSRGKAAAIAERAKTSGPAPGSSLAGPAWLLAGYDTGSFFVPLEPGHGTTARLVFSANGKLAGTTGFTAFAGTWKAGKADAGGYVPVTMTADLIEKSRAPNDTAVKFERDLLACISSTRLLKQEKDSFRLLDGQKRILLRYLAATAE